jgi:hypothetical protein
LSSVTLNFKTGLSTINSGLCFGAFQSARLITTSHRIELRDPINPDPQRKTTIKLMNLETGEETEIEFQPENHFEKQIRWFESADWSYENANLDLSQNVELMQLVLNS